MVTYFCAEMKSIWQLHTAMNWQGLLKAPITSCREHTHKPPSMMNAQIITLITISAPSTIASKKEINTSASPTP
jgi:hypothetical protein